MRLQKPFLFLIVSLIILSPCVKGQCKTKPPTKADIEKIFGKPLVDKSKTETDCFDKTGKKAVCPCDEEGYVCYGKYSKEARVKFDSTNNVESAEIYNSERNTVRLLFGELTEETWNKFGKLFDNQNPKTIDERISCQSKYRYENECFKILYIIGTEFCTNSAPIIITINWKK